MIKQQRTTEEETQIVQNLSKSAAWIVKLHIQLFFHQINNDHYIITHQVKKKSQASGSFSYSLIVLVLTLKSLCNHNKLC